MQIILDELYFIQIIYDTKYVCQINKLYNSYLIQITYIQSKYSRNICTLTLKDAVVVFWLSRSLPALSTRLLVGLECGSMEPSIAADLEHAKQLVPSLGREECAATVAAGAMAASGLRAE